jgi:prophage maintenance system killer protein
VVAEAFLLKNGYELIADDRDGVTAMLAFADGSMPEPDFAAWLRYNLQPRQTG